jgi:ADP-heptose:LPS heptosyltransferase
MKIGVIMYGGIGDHLLANRFVPSILNFHKESKVELLRPYLNNLDEFPGKNYPIFMMESFSNFYSGFKYIKKNISTHPDVWVDMQSTTNEFEEFNEYDIVYNLVPDALKWLTYDHLELEKYFKNFPSPHLNLKNDNQDYILFHPNAREDKTKQMVLNINQAANIVNFFKQKGERLICPVAPSNKFLIDFCKEIDLEMHECNLIEMWQFSKNCKFSICCDSAPKYFPFHFSKPNLTLTDLYSEIFLIRWVLNPRTAMPLNSKPEDIYDSMQFLLNLKNRLLYI